VIRGQTNITPIGIRLASQEPFKTVVSNGSETQGKMLHSVASGWLSRQREKILSVALISAILFAVVQHVAISY
jgi:hypothetical protein